MPTPSRPTAALAERLPTPSRWTMTLVTAVAAVVLRMLLQPVLGDKLPFLLAYPAVVLASSMWGIGSGVAVAVASAVVAAIPWIPPTIAADERPLHIGAFFLVAVAISLFTRAKPVDQLTGLVYGVGKIDVKKDYVAGDTAWYRSPALLGTAALVLCVALYLPFL